MSILKGDFVNLDLVERLEELTPGQRYLIADLTATLAHAEQEQSVRLHSAQPPCSGVTTARFPWRE